SGKCGRRRARLAEALCRPFTREAQLDVALAPGAGYRLIRAKIAGPGAGDRVAVALQRERPRDGDGVAGKLHLPRTGGFAAVLHQLRLRTLDVQVREVGFFTCVAL